MTPARRAEDVRHEWLLRQLRVKESLRFVDSSAEIPPGAIVFMSAGLGIVRTDFDTGSPTSQRRSGIAPNDLG